MLAKPDVLEVLRMLMSMLDELAASMEKSVLVLETYEKKLDMLNNFNITDAANLTQTVADLPPERAAAFMLAIQAMSKLLAAAERDKDVYERMVAQFKLVADMRSHLHMVLEGKPCQ